MNPLAYHITWTTYGTWLHGDARGSVAKREAGLLPPDPRREEQARCVMAEDEVRLTAAQRRLVEETITAHCRVRGWVLHAVNVRSNHSHVVVTADRAGKVVLEQFKAWASRRLSEQAGLPPEARRKDGRRRWWTEGGDVRPIWDGRYLENAVRYVAELQGD